MDIRDCLNDALKFSMKARESDKVGVFRLIFSEIKQKEVDGKKTLTETEILATLEKMLKQRRDSISQFSKAARQDLVDKEQFEVQLITGFMPTQLSENEISILIDKAIEELKKQTPEIELGPKSMGKIIAALRGDLAGKADMAKVSAMVKSKL